MKQLLLSVALECDLEISINNADEEQCEGSSRPQGRILEEIGLSKGIETAAISREIEQSIGMAPLDVGLSEEETHVRDAMQSSDSWRRPRNSL